MTLRKTPRLEHLAWFATLVALAGGLSQVGFVKWFAEVVANHMAGFTPVKAILLLLVINFSPIICLPASPRMSPR